VEPYERTKRVAAIVMPALIESVPADDVYAVAGSRPGGLTTDEAQTRLRECGPNVLQIARPRPFLVRFGAHFTHLMALLLWAGSLLAVIAGLGVLSIAIVLVNVINGVFSFWQEHKADKATEALRRLLPLYARVLRDGREARVPADQLVPGDVILLDEGDRISADARVVEHAELRVDQSTLTGETTPVRKTAEPAPAAAGNRADTPDLVFAGTNVSAGRGKAVVTATAMGTEFGRIAGLTQEMITQPSPLQQELRTLSTVVSIIAVAVGSFLATVALLLGVMDLAEGLVFGLAMIVAFVPEGLLPTVTLSLAMATQRMAERKALVKRLSAVETLGSTTVICTDKTGTLTQNEMTVREAYTLGGRFEFDGIGYDPDGSMRIVDPQLPSSTTESADADASLMLVAGSLSSNARLVANEERWTVLGDPTEAAVEVAARKAGIDLEIERQRAPRIHELPFDSRRKRMSTLHRVDGREVLYSKGAPRELIELCVQARVHGTDRPLDDSLRARIAEANDDMSRRGLRVLAIAQRQLDRSVERSPERLETELTFLGLIAMMDPPRPEVADAVNTCHRAGIRTIMITGDYGLTAESIARRVGLLHDPDVRIINGDEVSAMSEDELDEALRGEVLFARSSPDHKLRVVTALQRQRHVVAVTGDGVNDAPALKKADIGVAMGASGTDVAREAADVILLDDNFASIVYAVEEGRAVYANIRRFTSYIFTSNVPEAVPFTVFALSGGSIPLAIGVMAILAIDLGTDLVPALALGAEPPAPGLMDRRPRSRADHIADRPLLARAFMLLGAVQSLAVMAVFFGWFWTHGYWGQFLDLPDEGAIYHEAVSMALATVVVTQIGNLFAQRADSSSLRQVGWFSNRLVWAGIASELLIVAVIVYVPFMQRIFDTGSIPLSAWLWIVPLIPLIPLADGIRKTVGRRRRPVEREVAAT
jgi:magnesium-transporting ATPase (P-type)